MHTVFVPRVVYMNSPRHHVSWPLSLQHWQNSCRAYRGVDDTPQTTAERIVCNSLHIISTPVSVESCTSACSLHIVTILCTGDIFRHHISCLSIVWQGNYGLCGRKRLMISIDATFDPLYWPVFSIQNKVCKPWSSRKVSFFYDFATTSLLCCNTCLSVRALISIKLASKSTYVPKETVLASCSAVDRYMSHQNRRILVCSMEFS